MLTLSLNNDIFFFVSFMATIMNTKHPRNWPNDYLSFEGDMSELVATANEILQQLGYDSDLTERSFRHYQQKDLVGRGVKEGKSARFGFEELSQLVATKSLIKQGFTLQHTASLLQSESSSLGASTQSASQDLNNPSALDVVNQLMCQSQSYASPQHITASSSSTSFASSNAVRATALPSSLLAREALYGSVTKASPSMTPSIKHDYPMTKGVHLSVDDKAWRALSFEQQQDFLKALSSFSASIHLLFKDPS